MSWTITFSNPQNNYAGSGGLSAAVPVAAIGIEAEFNTISAATVLIKHDIASKYGLETSDSTNPCQLNSQVTISDGNTWFEGYVVSNPIMQDFDSGRYMQIEIHGLEACLTGTLVPYANGERYWVRESDTYALTALGLKATSAYGDFDGDTLWPDPLNATGAKLYLADASSNSDTLDTGILIGDVAPFNVILTTTDKGFLPRGWIKIGSEWMYYDGYDDTAAGGKYQCRVTARAQLGTTAAGHLAGATVYNKVAKEIAPGTVNLYKDAVRMRFDKEYAVLWRDGCFLLPSDAGASAYTGDYTVYDEDSSLDAGSVPLLMEDVVTTICRAPRAYGGAGFGAGDIDFDTLNIKLNRYEYDPEGKPEYAYDAIESLISGVGLEDEVKFWRDHYAGKLRLAIVALDTPALSLSHVERIEKESDLEDVYSGVLIKYVDDQPVNRIHSDWSWHVGCDTTGAKPNTWKRQTGDGSWGVDTETTDTGASGSSFGFDFLHDGKPGTKCMAEFEHDPGGSFVYGDFWFGDGATPPTLQLDEIDIRVNNYRAIDGWGRTSENDSSTYVVRVQGTDDYDTGTHDSAANGWRDLFEIEGKPEAEGVPELHTLSDFPSVNINAIRIIFDYMAGPKRDGEYYWAVVHDLALRGKQVKYVFVQTSDTTQQNPAYVYNQAAHIKLRGGPLAATSAGAPKCIKIDIGPSSEGAAYSVGRAWLRTKLRAFHMRHYEYRGALSRPPSLGMTVEVVEDGSGVDFTGVLYGYSYAYDDASGGSLQLKLYNPAASEIA